MINSLKTKTIGDKVQLSLEQFKQLISNYQTLKIENTELQKANNYLNNEIKKYNTEFANDSKKLS